MPLRIPVPLRSVLALQSAHGVLRLLNTHEHKPGVSQYARFSLDALVLRRKVFPC